MEDGSLSVDFRQSLKKWYLSFIWNIFSKSFLKVFFITGIVSMHECLSYQMPVCSKNVGHTMYKLTEWHYTADKVNPQKGICFPISCKVSDWLQSYSKTLQPILEKIFKMAGYFQDWFSLCNSVYIHTDTYANYATHTHTYTYIYIERERKREKEREICIIACIQNDIMSFSICMSIHLNVLYICVFLSLCMFMSIYTKCKYIWGVYSRVCR